MASLDAVPTASSDEDINQIAIDEIPALVQKVTSDQAVPKVVLENSEEDQVKIETR